MQRIPLGKDALTQKPIDLPKSAFSTHLHAVGGTGKGKTTALSKVLSGLLRDPTDDSCFVIIDRLGNFADELMIFASSPHFSTKRLRERVVYVEPSREDICLPFNPLQYSTRAHGYYRVERATEIILRAWESVNIAAMPRLARWVFNCFWAAAQLGLTIPDCMHFLSPGSRYHTPLLNVLPQRLQGEWNEILNARGDVVRILESTQNRLRPYFESDILRRTFGSCRNNMDFNRFIQEGRIVIINLAPRDRLSGVLANTYGALVLNELIAVARSTPPNRRKSTYVFLDEFQNYVGPDIEDALPEVRQLKLKLILSHQSFSQLQRGDYDLSSLIFQAQSRMVFGVQGEDADILAHEFGAITFDPYRVKDEIHSRRQLIKGHRKIELSSWSESESNASNWQKNYGTRTTSQSGYGRSRDRQIENWTDSDATGVSQGRSDGG
ncbi:MAG: type IV secretory system conjugative DNA transfer family protein, partial [Planctomycetota bacterium]